MDRWTDEHTTNGTIKALYSVKNAISVVSNQRLCESSNSTNPIFLDIPCDNDVIYNGGRQITQVSDVDWPTWTLRLRTGLVCWNDILCHTAAPVTISPRHLNFGLFGLSQFRQCIGHRRCSSSISNYRNVYICGFRCMIGIMIWRS